MRNGDRASGIPSSVAMWLAQNTSHAAMNNIQDEITSYIWRSAASIDTMPPPTLQNVFAVLSEVTFLARQNCLLTFPGTMAFLPRLSARDRLLSAYG